MKRGAGFGLHGVSVAFGGTAALHGIDLEVKPGEAVAFVGPSGSGKTTLLRLLNGTVRPQSGAVELDGRRLAHLGAAELRRARAAIGFIHQDLSLVPNLRVIQNVVAGKLGSRSFLGSLRSMFAPTRPDLEEIHALLERVGIGEKLYERTDRLSGGQRQRVAIARALFQDPSALLADEPVSSVDPTRANDTVRLLTEISRERGITLCMSLHNLDLAREFFPRLVGLRRGRICLDAPCDEIDDARFGELYHLEAGEILADGA